MHNATIGIDVGKSGFLCCLLDSGGMEFAAMPVIAPSAGRGKRRYDAASLVRALRGWAGQYEVQLVAIERQQVHPGQGSVSCFSLGEGFGLLVGIAAALGLPTETPHPRTWQAEILRDTPGRDPKARSLEVAGRLFPTVDLRRTDRCTTSDNNKSDALLLAEWARRKVAGGVK